MLEEWRRALSMSGDTMRQLTALKNSVASVRPLLMKVDLWPWAQLEGLLDEMGGGLRGDRPQHLSPHFVLCFRKYH